MLPCLRNSCDSGERAARHILETGELGKPASSDKSSHAYGTTVIVRTRCDDVEGREGQGYIRRQDTAASFALSTRNTLPIPMSRVAKMQVSKLLRLFKYLLI